MRGIAVQRPSTLLVGHRRQHWWRPLAGVVLSVAVLLLLTTRAAAASAGGASRGNSVPPRAATSFHAKEPIRMDMKVNVVLVGLNGDGAFGYAVQESSLASLLSTTLPTYRPALVEEQRPLHVEYNLHYDVHHQSNIPTFTALLGDELKKLQHQHGEGVKQNTYAVPLAGSSGWRSFFESISVADEYSVIIVNPCKRTLDKHMEGADSASEPQWHYHYTYNNGSTQYLSAGPLSYGPEAGEGAVTAASLPQLAKFERRLQQARLRKQSLYSHFTVSQFAEIQAHLSTIVISAIKHVFIPDIQFPAVQADKVLIPIMVLRNHVEFNPWDQGHQYSIDIETIKHEIEKLALPNQEVTVVTDMHGLHEHKHIALALAQAHKTDTINELGVLGRYHVKEAPYIDGRALLHQMKDAQDIIASRFLRSVEERAHLSAFYSRSQPGTDHSEAKVTQARPLGTRIIPVYVFSLLLSPNLQNVLLDRSSLYTASPEGVIVLQTNATKVSVPFFVEGSSVSLYPNDPTRHIVAGVATALGSMSSPLQRYSSLHDRLVHSHLWAVGHHPFGPYTTTPGLGQVYVDMAMRNAVLSRLDQALKIIFKSISNVDRFANHYLYGPFGESITVAKISDYEVPDSIEDAVRGTPDLWQGWEADQTASFQPLPIATVERLYGDMNRLASLLARIGALLKENKLRDAYEASTSVELGATTFADYVSDEISAAEAELICCYIRHIPAHSSPVTNMLQYLLVFVFAVVFMLALTVFLKRKARGSRQFLRRTKQL